MALAVAGCRPAQPGYLFEDGDLSHYVGVATQIEYPDVEACTLDDVKNALPPMTLENPEPANYWDLTLEEAARIALCNSKVLRILGPTYRQGGDPDYFIRGLGAGAVAQTGGASGQTIWDPALTETDARFGVEAALSAFDTHFATTMNWQRAATPQNSADFVEVFRPSTFLQDLATFQAQLSKINATGGRTTLRHNVGYELNNSGGRQFASDYTANLELEVRQPLLQGFGVAYNRIAGPGAIPGFNNGVMIARLKTDETLAGFENNVRNMLSDVENAYWHLYRLYRSLDSAIVGRDFALQTWRQVRAKFDVGGRGGGAQEEAQARQEYFRFRAAAETLSQDRYKAERNLRYMLGLGATDGRLIRPADEPTTAKVTFDWYEVHAEAMVRSVELRKHKWVVKSRELELIAAKNYLLPRLDAVAQYRWNGLGHILLDKDNSESNAYGSLTSGQYPAWLLGFEFSMPLGFRKEMAGVRHAQMALARERAILQEQELELSHQLAAAFGKLVDMREISETHFNRRIAAQREVEAAKSAYENGTLTLDLLLRAEEHRAQAEVAYYDSLVEYNIAIKDLHFKKGSLLDYNGVYLAEGPWPAKAYFDARRRARARDASVYLNYGFTRPSVISRGPVVQGPGEGPLGEGGPDFSAPDSPETIPAPMPEPTGQPTAPGTTPQSKMQRGQPGGPIGPALNAAAMNRGKGTVPFSLRENWDSLRPMSGRPAERRQVNYDLGAMSVRVLSTRSQGSGEADSPVFAPRKLVPSPAGAAAAGPTKAAVQPTAYQESQGKEERAEARETRSTDNSAVSISIQSSSTSAKPAGDGWKGAKRSDTRHEPVADLPSAPTDQSASGWKRVQR